MIRKRKKRAKVKMLWPSHSRGVAQDSSQIYVILQDDNSSNNDDADSSSYCCRRPSETVRRQAVAARLCVPSSLLLLPPPTPPPHVRAVRSRLGAGLTVKWAPPLKALLFIVSCWLSMLIIAAPTLIDSTADNSVIIETDSGQLFKGVRFRSNNFAPATASSRKSSGRQQQIIDGTQSTSSSASASAGAYDTDVIAFLGIRYASAPVKRLRFMPPTPFNYAPNQVHDGRNFGPICMQKFPLELSRRQMELIRELGGLTGLDAQKHNHRRRGQQQQRRSLKVNLMSTETIGGNITSSLQVERAKRQTTRRPQTPRSAVQSSGDDGSGGGAGVDTQKIQLQLALMAGLLPGSSGGGVGGNSFIPPTLDQNHRNGRRGHRGRQRPSRLSLSSKSLFELDQSEDCLNLNIYTPIEALRSRMLGQEQAPIVDDELQARGDKSQGDEDSTGQSFTSNNQLEGGQRVGSHEQTGSERNPLLPVLVIVHGESFDYGSGATISGQKFARDNRLVVVTFNFRLNILGFPPKLNSAQSAASGSDRAGGGGGGGSSLRGNLGLLDQVALLHWIQANIGSFGGSSANVTLMGVKRGAIFVNLLMLSPLAKGLFSRAILEDGSALSPMVANNIQSMPSSPQFATPTAATAAALSSSTSGGVGPLQGQQQVALQHVRLLARLCDCPIYAPKRHQLNNSSSSSSASFGQLSEQKLQQKQQQQQQLGLDQFASSGYQDETRANLLMFECLKSSPIELIMQQVPYGLIDTSQLLLSSSSSSANQVGAGSSEFALDKRWHKPLQVLFSTLIGLNERIVPASLKVTLNELYEQLFKAAMNDNSDGKSIKNSGASGNSVMTMVMISPGQLDKLIAHLVTAKQLIVQAANNRAKIREQVEEKREGEEKGEEAAEEEKEKEEEEAEKLETANRVKLVFKLLDSLLGAIYLPSNETLVSPIYAPQLDSGTILLHNEHDLTESMLQKQSLFGRHDLLIGSSAPLVDFGTTSANLLQPSDNDKLSNELSAIINQYYSSSSSSTDIHNDDDDKMLPFNDLIYPIERFSRRQLSQVGLSDEQAIKQVSLFVRTYYRYHQQEITNSIINHYFLNFDQQQQQQQQSMSGGVGGNRRVSPTGGIKFTSAAASGSGSTYEEHKRMEQEQFKRRRQALNAKQLNLLQALINVYHDSLISVPLVKTALIHSIKQLESLVDPFINQHVIKLSERFRGSSGGGSSRAAAGISGDILSNITASEREALANSALVEFNSFVSQLYDNSVTIQWPIELLRQSQQQGQHRQQQPGNAIGRELDGIHSTYLYQFGNLNSLINKLALVINRINRIAEKSTGGAGKSEVLAEISENLLNNVLVKLLSNKTGPKFERQLGLGCSFANYASDYDPDDNDSQGDDDDSDSEDDGDESRGGPDIGSGRGDQNSKFATNQLLDQLKGWICDKLGHDVVARFVKTGNVNWAATRLEPIDASNGSDNIDEQLEQYALNCVAKSSQQHDIDHHSVQLNNSIATSSRQPNTTSSVALIEQQQQQVDDQKASSSSSSSSLRRSKVYTCHKQLNWLTMNYLLRELAPLWPSQAPPPVAPRGAANESSIDNGDRGYSDNNWPVFNVFSQQIATLVHQGDGGANLWRADSFSQDKRLSSMSSSSPRASSNGDGGAATSDERLSRDHFDRKLAFWANFIPTLNCSRTQPISPNSLLYSTLASNSTLLNMNLHFNCYQSASVNTGAVGALQQPTASSLIESIYARIKQTMLDFINEHLIKQQQQQQKRRLQMAAAAAATDTTQMSSRQQNHHSLRMASSMINEMLNGSQQDDSSVELAADRQLMNGSSEAGASAGDWPTMVSADQRQHEQQELLVQQSPAGNQSLWPFLFSNATQASKSANRKTLAGLWISASTILLVGTTILTSGCVLLNHRRRRQQQQQQQQQLKRKQSQLNENDDSSNTTNATNTGHLQRTNRDSDPSSSLCAKLSLNLGQEALTLEQNSVDFVDQLQATATNRSSSTPSSSMATRIQQQHQHRNHYNDQQEQLQMQQQLVQEPAHGSGQFDLDPNQQGNGNNNENNGDNNNNCLNGYVHQSTSFIDYNSLLAQQQQQHDDRSDTSLIQYAYSQDNDDDEQQQQRIILPIMSAPSRYLNVQQQQQQQQFTADNHSIRGLCHHLDAGNLVLVQNANNSNNNNSGNTNNGQSNGNNHLKMNHQQLQQHQQQLHLHHALSSGSETTATATTTATSTANNRHHSSVSLVSSPTPTTTTTATNSKFMNNNNNNSNTIGGPNSWRQNQPKKRVKISDPMRQGGQRGPEAVHQIDNVDRIIMADSAIPSNGDINLSSSQLYLNNDYLLCSLLDEGHHHNHHDHHHHHHQAPLTGDYCPIHLTTATSGSSYLQLSATPTSLIGDCDNRLYQQFNDGSINQQVVPRYLKLIANNDNDNNDDEGGKSDESPIATVGSLSDYLNITSSNNLNNGNGAFNSLNNGSNQPIVSNYNQTNYSVQSAEVAQQYTGHYSLGKRATASGNSKRQSNKTSQSTLKVCSVHSSAGTKTNTDLNSRQHYAKTLDG